jgi:hypothetical protein
MTATLRADLLPLLNEMIQVIERERDPVRQQQLIELLTVRHCLRAGSSQDQYLELADGVAKHVRQLIGQEQ